MNSCGLTRAPLRHLVKMYSNSDTQKVSIMAFPCGRTTDTGQARPTSAGPGLKST
ncbi:MAG: hypothetical protein HQ549_02880 [Candidatus Omnitrophica bacterium]|nr:hypothetical protein [Candidatus Omnitrophota bacterium]